MYSSVSLVHTVTKPVSITLGMPEIQEVFSKHTVDWETMPWHSGSTDSSWFTAVQQNERANREQKRKVTPLF